MEWVIQSHTNSSLESMEVKASQFYFKFSPLAPVRSADRNEVVFQNSPVQKVYANFENLSP